MDQATLFVHIIICTFCFILEKGKCYMRPGATYCLKLGEIFHIIFLGFLFLWKRSTRWFPIYCWKLARRCRCALNYQIIKLRIIQVFPICMSSHHFANRTISLHFFLIKGINEKISIKSSRIHWSWLKKWFYCWCIKKSFSIYKFK